MVGDQQRRTVRGYAIEPLRVDAPPLSIEEDEERLHQLLELRVETKLVGALGSPDAPDPIDAIDAGDDRGQVGKAGESEPAVEEPRHRAFARAHHALELSIESCELGLERVDGLTPLRSAHCERS